ncbi:MAG: 4-hydroxybenzoate octaprenyltransferase, partial [Flavisolibacter sp.]
MTKVRSYLSLIKFAHTIFAMPFALIGFFLAIMLPDLYLFGPADKVSSWSVYYDYAFLIKKFVFVILCMVFAR